MLTFQQKILVLQSILNDVGESYSEGFKRMFCFI